MGTNRAGRLTNNSAEISAGATARVYLCAVAISGAQCRKKKRMNIRFVALNVLMAAELLQMRLHY